VAGALQIETSGRLPRPLSGVLQEHGHAGALAVQPLRWCAAAQLPLGWR
jgi:hypothetical protein